MKEGPILGVEGGGTKTAWVLVERAADVLRILDQGKLPPSNFRLTPPDRLCSIFRQLPREVERVGMFLAGCGPDDHHALKKLCEGIWTGAKIVAGSDRDSGLAAAFANGDGIAVNAGTGSSITGRRGGRMEKAGGWGHILGDAGGGYYLSIQALRLLLREFDLHRGETEFAAEILRALCLNTLDELVRWAQTADKMEISALTPVVFAAAERGDARVQDILEGGARVLAEYTEAVATRLDLTTPEVRLIGGLFQNCPVYVAAFARDLTGLLPNARVEVAERPPEFGAAWLAAETGVPLKFAFVAPDQPDGLLATASTEKSNPRSDGLERMSAREVVELFVDEEHFVQDALRERAVELAAAIDLVAGALRGGGRLFYVGAGTSGRLGVLDASEIPPTFGAPSERVQGILAGGVSALYRSAEGSEDDMDGGVLAMDGRAVAGTDVVCGITASGRTPFVLGALLRARALGARTILLTCNPERDRPHPFDLEIDLATGPELLTGSTRLKAGTATKVALNIISTGAMVALGKVHRNLMIDLAASNDKLRDRAARLLSELAGCDHSEARKRLMAKGWNLRAALGADLSGSAKP